MSLERLNNLLRPIDTGLKAVVAVELSRNGEVDAPSLTRDLIERGIISMVKTKTLLKKIESVKGALDGMYKFGFANKFDTGEKRFQTPSHTYTLKDSLDSRNLVDIASRTIDVCSGLEYPCHDFWDIRGGGFSTDLKHVRQGMQMATFYSIMPEDLVSSVGTDIWEVLTPETLPSVEIQKRLGLTKVQMKSYLRKFVAKGFFNKSSGIRNGSIAANSDLKNNGYCLRRSAGNTRLYSLNDLSQSLVTELFIPCLAVASGCSNGEIQETKSKYSDCRVLDCAESKIVGMHYNSIKNQFS